MGVSPSRDESAGGRGGSTPSPIEDEDWERIESQSSGSLVGSPSERSFQATIPSEAPAPGTDRAFSWGKFAKYCLTNPASEDKAWFREMLTKKSTVDKVNSWLKYQGLDSTVRLSGLDMNPNLDRRGYIPYGYFRKKVVRYQKGEISTMYGVEYLLHPTSPELADSILSNRPITGDDLKAMFFTKSVESAKARCSGEPGRYDMVVFLAAVPVIQLKGKMLDYMDGCIPKYALPLATAHFADVDEAP